MSISVAYQGERGAFSEAAAVRLLGREIEPVPCASFDDMFAAVDGKAADCCIAPIEGRQPPGKMYRWMKSTDLRYAA